MSSSVHLDHLELERHQAAPRVSLDEQDPAVHLLSCCCHAHDLVERLGRGYVAVFFAAPLFPQFPQLIVQQFAFCFRLEFVPLSEYISPESADHRLAYVAVSLQVAGAGADHIPTVTVRQLRALVENSPPGS